MSRDLGAEVILFSSLFGSIIGGFSVSGLLIKLISVLGSALFYTTCPAVRVIPGQILFHPSFGLLIGVIQGFRERTTFIRRHQAGVWHQARMPNQRPVV